MKIGFTLIELIIVIIIIGILATFAVPQYFKTQERALDNEAKANLVLIQAAENIFKTESNAFYGSSTVHADLNSNLSISLPPAGGKWNYSVKKSGVAPLDTLCAQAERNITTKRYWSIDNTANAPTTVQCK